MDPAELFLSLTIGIGLAAACGFRIFVPLLVTSLAAHTGHLELAQGFEWMASTTAIFAFGSATVLEIGAYYLPFIDNLLDAVTGPSAVVAGAVVAGSQVGDMSPLLAWSLAVIGGGGAAGLVQGLTTVARQFSALATAGFGNPILSTFEAGASLSLAVVAIVVPLVAVFAVLLLLFFAVKKIFFRNAATEPTAMA